MYSGLTLTRFSGCFLGTHQKVDRLALRRLKALGVTNEQFPSLREILHFEGNKGPDALKRKSPSINEPGHYFDPSDDGNQPLLDLIDHHYESLADELQAGNRERSAFEAAWLAHALTDGLTPAHQYPYEAKLSELRGGLTSESRNSIRAKWIVPGSTKRGKLANNWKVWGAGGLLITHGTFEMGIATIMKPLTLAESSPTIEQFDRLQSVGLRDYFREVATDIDKLKMYERYYQKGWTPKLASEVRHILAPAIVNTIAVAWFSAYKRARPRL